MLCLFAKKQRSNSLIRRMNESSIRSRSIYFYNFDCPRRWNGMIFCIKTCVYWMHKNKNLIYIVYDEKIPGIFISDWYSFRRETHIFLLRNIKESPKISGKTQKWKKQVHWAAIRCKLKINPKENCHVLRMWGLNWEFPLFFDHLVLCVSSRDTVLVCSPPSSLPSPPSAIAA